MIDDIKNRGGIFVEHQDGRKGIAYHDDQLKKYQEEDKYIVRFFTDNDITAGLRKERRAVKHDKLTIKGYIN